MQISSLTYVGIHIDVLTGGGEPLTLKADPRGSNEARDVSKEGGTGAEPPPPMSGKIK